MKVLFVYRGSENIGVQYLSATLQKANHKVELVYDPNLFNSHYVKNKLLDKIFNFKKKVIADILASNAKIICFSVVSDDYEWACYIAEEIKKFKNNSVIVFGGVHPSAVAELVIEQPFVDYVCIGEGEEALVELVDALENNKNTTSIANIQAKVNGKIYYNPIRKLVEDIDSLALPDKDIFHNQYNGFNKDHYTIITSRGCPHDCSFCYNNCLRKLYKDKGKYLRRRSVKNVIEELEIAKEKYKPWMISFYDDIFTYDKHWLAEFSVEYKEKINLPFFCFVHPAHIDRERLSLLEDMKCSVVAMGIQSVDAKMRRDVLKRYESNEQIKKAIKLFSNNNIFLSLTVIPGLPNQTIEEMEKTLLFLNEYPGDHTHFLWLRYYPKCEIVDIALRLKVLTEDQVRRINNADNASTGYSLNKKMGVFINMILISHVLPKKMLNFIIRKKIYRYIPSFAISFYAFVHHELKALIFFSFRKILCKNETVNRSAIKSRFLYYWHYMLKKMVSCLPAKRDIAKEKKI